MIATLTVCPEPNRPAAEPDFLDMLPAIRRVASYAFRHLRRAVREDLMAEVVASAFAAFQRLVARGKAALAYPTVLAKFAIRQVRAGRRIGAKQNKHDVLSALAQRCHGLQVRLVSQSEERDWEQLTVDRKATPADIAACRIDFRCWLAQLQLFKRQVAVVLAEGATTKEAAEHFRVSTARISQLRRELGRNWQAFQAIPAGP